MKKTIWALACLFLCLAASSQAQQLHRRDWIGYKVSDDPAYVSVGIPLFADSATGYFTTGPVYGQTKWYRTLNGGATWQNVVFYGLAPLDTDKLYPLYYCAPSPNSIFFVGGSYSKIIYSQDRGLHWDTAWSKAQGSVAVDVHQYFTMFTEQTGIAGRGAFKTLTGVRGFLPNPTDSMFKTAENSWESGGSISPSGGDFSSMQYGCFPVMDRNLYNGRGLTTIVTEDGGATWKKYDTIFPGYENDSLYGDCRFQKGTLNVWEFPLRRRETPEPTAEWYHSKNNPSFNISYCYSEDGGKTWGYDTSFFSRKIFVFGVAPGNVWMLLLPKPYGNYSRDGIHSPYPPPLANTIAHTTDYGKTWDLDTVSLNVPDIGKAGAAQLYFTDKDHGWISAMINKTPYVFKYLPTKFSDVSEAPSAQSLEVYPNPARDVLHVEASGSVQVLDALGRAYALPNHDGTLDVSQLPVGVYYISDGKQRARFVKE
jgi:hypothetical protein